MGMPREIIMVMLSFIATFILVEVRVQSFESNSYCTEEKPSDDDPPRPKMNYSFTTQISGKWVDLKGLAYVYEYFDHEDNKLAYDSLWQGFEYSEIYDFDRKTLLFSLQERCTFLSEYEAARNFSEEGLRSLEILLNVGSVWKYKGKTTIRGVDVQQWRSCGRWTNWANFTTDYYFTVKDQNPFRFEMKGTKSPSNSDPNKKLHRIYDYVLFQRTKPPGYVFKPPPGEACGSQAEMTPPLPTSASYGVEEMNPQKKTVTNSHVFYDKQKRLSKEVYEEKTVIYDFKRGYLFEIDRESNVCTRKPFYTLENSVGSVDVGVIHADTLKFFYIGDKNYTYNGVHRARGISCDLYTKKSHSAEEVGVSIVEIFVARPDVKMISESGEVLSSLRQPVQILLKGGPDKHHTKLKRQYEIYDFRPTDLAFNTFDLTPCFNKEKIVRFSIVYEGGGIDNSLSQRLKMLSTFSAKISSYLGIVPLRVSITDAIFTGDSLVKISGALFDREDEGVLFETLPNTQNVINKTEDLYHVFQNLENTPTLCSEFCIEDSNTPFHNSTYYCWAFQFDRQTKNCTCFFQKHRDVDDTVEDLAYSEHVDLYRRTSSDRKDYTNVSDSWSLLKKGVKRGLINYTVSNDDLLTATSVTRVDNKTVNVTEMHQVPCVPISQFYAISGAIKTNPVETIVRITISACARHCLQSLKYDCQAFQHDHNALACSFFDTSSYSHNNSHESTKATSKVTTYYARYYASNFERIVGRTVLLSLNQGYVYKAVNDVNSCAKICVQNTQFHCQSFEMCSGVCILGQYHFYDVLSKNVSENHTCVHYSRNYIQDYTRTTTEKMVLVGLASANIDVEQCATICSTSPFYPCDAFEFCGIDSTCQLLLAKTRQNKSTKYLDVRKRRTCNIYSRKPGVHRIFKKYDFDLPKDTDTAEVDGHTLLSMIVTAVGMFFLGFALVIIVTLAIIKIKLRCRSRRVSHIDTPVGFSSKNNREAVSMNRHTGSNVPQDTKDKDDVSRRVSSIDTPVSNDYTENNVSLSPYDGMATHSRL